MSDSVDRQGVIVGLFIAGGVALLAGAVLTVGDIEDTFTRKITVSAVFDGVGGLHGGSNVWFRGVKVGVVKGLHFTEDSRVEVEMAIDRDAAVYISEDSLAKIGSDGLIGNRIVVLTDGEADAAIADGAKLEVAPMVAAEDVLAMVQENNTNLLAITDDLQEITAGLAAGEGTAGRLLGDDTLYAQLDETVAGFGETSDDAQVLVGSLNTFSRTLNHEGAVAVGHVAQGVAARDTPAGMLLHDERVAADLKATTSNLEESSALLAEELEALKHTFPLRGYYKRKARDAERRNR